MKEIYFLQSIYYDDSTILSTINWTARFCHPLYTLFILSLGHWTLIDSNVHDSIVKVSGVASSISEGDIFIYSCFAQLISFEIKSISKEINCAKHKYVNMSPSLIELATPLVKVCQIQLPRINKHFYLQQTLLN